MAVGVERLLLIAPEQEKIGIDLFIAALGTEARETAVPWMHTLRQNGLTVEMAWEDKSLKAQMKQADRHGAGLVLIVGESEIENEEALLRDMETREQQTIPFDKLTDTVLELFED